MGRKSRDKAYRRRAPKMTDKPRWAGAPGFDRAYFIASLYADTRDRLREAQKNGDRYGEAEAQLDVASIDLDFVQRKVTTLETAARRRGIDVGTREERAAERVGVPGDYPGSPADFRHYAETLGAMADDHLAHLREATPIVFDPLSVPGLSLDAVEGLGLPFPVVVADFLAPGGMSLPVQSLDDSDWWVGLVAATVAQGEEGGPVDVWPTVMTLNAERSDSDQVPTEVMFGRARFGGPLPSPPDGLDLVEFDGGAAWIISDIKDGMSWADMWVVKPALAAISALRVLDAVNVNLADVTLPRAARRRAEREGAIPARTVDITTGRSSSSAVATGGNQIEWKHRWMVRGHWKHFGEQTAVARRHPSRVKDVPGHGRCVRVWCPPFVKGPADKPLVLKTRVVSNVEC